MVGTTYDLIVQQTGILKAFADDLRRGGRGDTQTKQLEQCLQDWACLYGGGIYRSMQKFLEGFLIAAHANIKGRQCDLVYFYGELHQGLYMLSDYFAQFGAVREDFLREWGIYANKVIHTMLSGASPLSCAQTINIAAAVIEFNVCNYMDDPIWPPPETHFFTRQSSLH
jgi:hypothetical protein